MLMLGYKFSQHLAYHIIKTAIIAYIKAIGMFFDNQTLYDFSYFRL